MDGLLYGEEREREREIHPEYSRVLLLAHKLRLFSFPILPLWYLGVLVGISYVEGAVSLNVCHSTQVEIHLIASKDQELFSLPLSFSAPSGISSTCSIRRPFVFLPLLPSFFYSLCLIRTLSPSLRDAVSRIRVSSGYTHVHGFSVSLSRFFFSVSLGTFIKGTRVKGKWFDLYRWNDRRNGSFFFLSFWLIVFRFFFVFEILVSYRRCCRWFYCPLLTIRNCISQF